MNNFAVMKKIVAIALISLIMLPNFSSILVYFSYKINQAEISRTLCIQKDFVNNTCNGRCVLETKLKKLEQNQKNAETNIKEKSEIVFTFFSTSFQEIKSVFSLVTNKEIAFKREPYFFSFITSIFHPPSL